MEIINVPFETPVTFEINGKKVELHCFKTIEHGNIKFGVNAPKSIGVDREEVHLMKATNNL